MSALSPLVRIADAPVDPREVERAVTTRSDGAVVTFTGLVRDHDHGRSVTSLEYSAHPRAETFLRQLCAEVARGFTRTGTHAGESEQVIRVAACHRVGTLEVGDVAVAVAAAAPHRREAFEACETLIHRLKHEIPIWKRQMFAEGLSEWVGAGECGC